MQDWEMDPVQREVNPVPSHEAVLLASMCDLSQRNSCESENLLGSRPAL